MDLLFSKYASPFSFIDILIDCGRFSEFIDEFYQAENEEKEWQFFLHKVYDKSFEDFKEAMKPQPVVNLETTVKTSKNILDNFKPE